MMSKWVCPDCRHSNNGHAKYCIKCGHFKAQRVVPQSKITWLCPICKTENHDTAKYCYKCGHWLLSETHMPTKVEKTTNKSQPQYQPQRTQTYSNSSSQISKTAIIEICLLAILSLLVLVTGSDFATIFALIFFVHIVFCFIYVVKSFVKQGTSKGIISILKHAGTVFGLLILFVIFDASTNTKQSASVNEIEHVINNAVELEYEDLLRNAEGKYKGAYVKIVGEVYHLEKGGQKRMMVNMSKDPLQYDAIFVERNEQDVTVIADDKVVIYGKVTGTVPTTNLVGAESAVPAIESYSMSLSNKRNDS